MVTLQLVRAVNDLKNNLEADQVAEIESPQAFSELLPIFRQASKDKIIKVLKTNDKIQYVHRLFPRNSTLYYILVKLYCMKPFTNHSIYNNNMLRLMLQYQYILCNLTMFLLCEYISTQVLYNIFYNIKTNAWLCIFL